MKSTTSTIPVPAPSVARGRSAEEWRAAGWLLEAAYRRAASLPLSASVGDVQRVIGPAALRLSGAEPAADRFSVEVALSVSAGRCWALAARRERQAKMDAIQGVA